MKLFVANIAKECSEEELNSAFAECGEVKSLKIIKDRENGQSRGFGFVEMSNRSGGQEAMKKLNEKEFHGRAIIVNEAREQERRAPHGQRSGGGYRR